MTVDLIRPPFLPVVRPEPLSCIKKSPSPALLHDYCNCFFNGHHTVCHSFPLGQFSIHHSDSFWVAQVSCPSFPSTPYSLHANWLLLKDNISSPTQRTEVPSVPRLPSRIFTAELVQISSTSLDLNSSRSEKIKNPRSPLELAFGLTRKIFRTPKQPWLFAVKGDNGYLR